MNNYFTKYISLVIFSILNITLLISSSDNKEFKIEVNRQNKIIKINKKEIDLKGELEIVLNKINSKYERLIMPDDYELVILKEFPIDFTYNIKKKQIVGIDLYFYYKKESPKNNLKIKEVIIGDLKINYDTSFEKFKSILTNIKVNFKIKEYENRYYITTENYFIDTTYLKDNLKTPGSIGISL